MALGAQGELLQGDLDGEEHAAKPQRCARMKATESHVKEERRPAGSALSALISIFCHRLSWRETCLPDTAPDLPPLQGHAELFEGRADGSTPRTTRHPGWKFSRGANPSGYAACCAELRLGFTGSDHTKPDHLTPAPPAPPGRRRTKLATARPWPGT